jgi:uncharacterized membrane protein
MSVKKDNRNNDQDDTPSISMIFNKLKTRWRLFTQSILYLPVIFVVGAVLLFLLTSRLDDLYYQKITLDVPYLTSLIFAGSSDAARSILSTIAAGWATILGVAFSVTLITLQLSITKYTSHLVSRFEGDKINQFTLGWFIAVVTYALLVLKTIRTSDGVGGAVEGAFTPLVGVNVAVVMAIISLFLFVLFLRNIGSYLRPNILVTNVTNQILSSLRSYEIRIPDKRASFKNKLQYGRKLLEVRSKNEGVLGNINWQTISKSLLDLNDLFDDVNQNHQKSNKNSNYYYKNNNNSPRKYDRNINSIPVGGSITNEESRHTTTKGQQDLWMELTKSIGESIRKNDILAVVYSCADQQYFSSSIDADTYQVKQKSISQKNNGNNDGKSDKPDIGLNQENINKYTHKILAAIEITQERTYDKDPLFGVELLRSLAVKSAAMDDTDVVKSTVTGLFKILSYAVSNEEKFGIPFYIHSSQIENQRGESSPQEGTNINDHKTRIIFINPKEVSLSDTIMNELSVICNMAADGKHLPIITHFVEEYISLSRVIIDFAPPKSSEEFTRVTDWFSQLLLYAYTKFPDYLKKQITTPIGDFNNDLYSWYPQASRTLKIHMKNIIDESS